MLMSNCVIEVKAPDQNYQDTIKFEKCKRPAPILCRPKYSLLADTRTERLHCRNLVKLNVALSKIKTSRLHSRPDFIERKADLSIIFKNKGVDPNEINFGVRV